MAKPERKKWKYLVMRNKTNTQSKSHKTELMLFWPLGVSSCKQGPKGCDLACDLVQEMCPQIRMK